MMSSSNLLTGEKHIYTDPPTCEHVSSDGLAEQGASDQGPVPSHDVEPVAHARQEGVLDDLWVGGWVRGGVEGE